MNRAVTKWRQKRLWRYFLFVIVAGFSMICAAPSFVEWDAGRMPQGATVRLERRPDEGFMLVYSWFYPLPGTADRDAHPSHYNIRWANIGLGETQVETCNSCNPFVLNNATRELPHSFRVQACNRQHTPECSPWTEMTYYLPNGEDTCKMGFVWREAGGPMDHTCVTPDGHNQAQLENQHNPRVPLVPVPGHGNANACPGGFVPRDAHGARDTVCVSPSRRAAVVAEDAAANSRRVIDQSFGPDTCKPFFVWREAVGGDHVCVSPELKQQAVDDNRLAASRVAGGGPFGADTCKQGLVWREISQADHVCVLPRVKAKNDEDTKLAAFRRANGPHG